MNIHRYIPKLAASGGTFIRVWMAAWQFAIEWRDTGLGIYTNRMYNGVVVPFLLILIPSPIQRGGWIRCSSCANITALLYSWSKTIMESSLRL